ncbi:MAG TPA: hypothetical protein VF174_09755 [Micromonosporaceae bacterium]
MSATSNGSQQPPRRPAVPPRRPRRGDLGLGALIVSPGPAAIPATNASWAWAMRRLARAMLGALPLYAVVFGLVTLGPFDGDMAGRDLTAYLADGRWLHLIGWLGAVWLGLMAIAAITALLAATRSRRTAAAGLMLAVAATALTLPFSALPGDTEVGLVHARALVLAGAVVHSLAWVLAGVAVARSGLLAVGDGVVLVAAGPMLGIVGLLVGPLQTVGALLALAAGLGLLWRSGRALPVADVPDDARPELAEPAGGPEAETVPAS